MPSTKDYLDFVLDQLSGLEDITFRQMMGEYIIYYRGKIVGGIYDNRFLVKPTTSARAKMPLARFAIPYEGAKEMLSVDEIDNSTLLTEMITAMYDELPEVKKNNDPTTFKVPYIQHYSTPSAFSDILMSSDGKVLTGLWFCGSHDERKHTSNCVEKDLPIFRETARWLDIYFNGHQPDFTPAYKMENLTPFRKDVVEIISRIPFGKLLTYSEIAQQIAKKYGLAKMSAQAVGGAVGWNPICIIVPCHRVVGANNKLTGYGGGIENKIALLRVEGINMLTK